MRKLDRTRPYAEIYPNGGFEQDHLVFDLQGNEVVKESAPAVPAPAPAAVDSGTASSTSDGEGTDEQSEARKVDLNDPKNAHLRPAAQRKKEREAG